VSLANVTDTTLVKRAFPVIEVFGPTIQGEGAEAGRPCYFVRLGGCDYRCSWCDTMYAVDPVQVRAEAEYLDAGRIAERVAGLGGRAEWVVISGGNPALHELGEVVDELHAEGLKVAVETQGSVWKEWLGGVDRLTVSPKPPSSGMASEARQARFEAFMQSAQGAGSWSSAVLKIVCFDEKDLAWAKGVAGRWKEPAFYLSAGTPVPPPPDLAKAVGQSFRRLCESVAGDPDLAHARVLPQLHVIAWGEERGV
jgi:7-carboxy-7-deazaguanine synthase